MQIYYLGPKFSFTYKAGLKMYPAKKLKPAKSIEQVLQTVKNKNKTLGLVPVENSTQGVVIRTLDFILEKKLKVIGEINIKIKQNLVSQEKKLNKIKTVYSHPHALAQAKKWLKTNLPNVKIEQTNSTSQAAKMAAKEKSTAAIAAKETAKYYKLNILAREIEQNKINLTRFWLVAKPKTKTKKIPELKNLINTKTSLYLIIKDRVGALKDLLDTFAKNQISLTAIQSRPLQSCAWQYGFFMDLCVDANDPLAQKMIQKLKKEHQKIKILGTYPQIGKYNQKVIVNYNLNRIEKIFSSSLEHALIKKLIQKNQKQIKTKTELKKILKTRYLIIPSVARYKYQKTKSIHDKKREKQLNKKLAQSLPLQKLYQNQILKKSKEIQGQIIQMLKQKEIKKSVIKKFSLKQIRYYIDYLDALALNSYLGWRAK